MEFNYRAVDKRPHSNDQHPLSRYSYITEQPIRGGLFGMRRNSDYLQSSVREEIHSELDKERTRDGFVEENSGRRSLEDELRRDLRMENELASRGRGINEVSRYLSGMGMRVEETSLEERIAKIVEGRIVSSLEGRIVMALERSGLVERIARTVEERMAISLERRVARTLEQRMEISLQRFGTEARREIEEQPLVPFRPGRVECSVKEVEQSLSHDMKEVISDANRSDTNALPKHGVRIAGSTASTDAAAPKKNLVKEEWSCSLCKVRTTSKRTLDDHVRGKKHKLNEASLNLGSKRKNSDNALPPNKKAILIS